MWRQWWVTFIAGHLADLNLAPYVFAHHEPERRMRQRDVCLSASSVVLLCQPLVPFLGFGYPPCAVGRTAVSAGSSPQWPPGRFAKRSAINLRGGLTPYSSMSLMLEATNFPSCTCPTILACLGALHSPLLCAFRSPPVTRYAVSPILAAVTHPSMPAIL